MSIVIIRSAFQKGKPTIFVGSGKTTKEGAGRPRMRGKRFQFHYPSALDNEIENV